MPREPISFADHAWLRMSEPGNLMIITSLMTFNARLDPARLRGCLEQLPQRYRRFRQRLVQPRLPFRRPYWQDDPHFNLETHLLRIPLPVPRDQKILQDLVGLLMRKDLDHARPLWQFYLLESYGRGSALIGRLHHSLADGISLMQVLLSLTEPAPDLLPDHHSTEPVKTLKANSVNRGRPGAGELLSESKQMLLHPTHAARRLRQGAGLAAAAGKMILRPPDPPTIFTSPGGAPLGIQKHAAWSKPLPLQQVKGIGKALGGTVNDVLVTALAGALGRYSRLHGASTDGVTVRSFIPINLRPVALDGELGNKMGMMFLSLPLGIQDPVERLRQVKHNMDALKTSAEALASYSLINLMGMLPDRLQGIAAALFEAKGTTIITNVPGPRAPLYFAGAPISTILAWVPQTGRISLGFSIVSYNGQVLLGVAADEGLIPNPETLVDLFYLEIQEMLPVATVDESTLNSVQSPSQARLPASNERR